MVWFVNYKIPKYDVDDQNSQGVDQIKEALSG